MFSHVLKPSMCVCPIVVLRNASKKFSTSCQRQFKVTVAGAAGNVGQSLSLLLKQNSLVTQLALYDVAPTTLGVAVDLSHVNTSTKVTGYMGPDYLACAVQCADLVLISANVPPQPGMSREDLFNCNACVMRDLVACIAQYSPKAIIAIMTNPINSMVPIAAEVLKRAGVYDPSRVLGVTTIDAIRAATFVGEINKIDPALVNVPVIGGHSPVTTVPVLSQSYPVLQLTDMKKIIALTERIQEAGSKVECAKGGMGSAALTMAYAGARITHAVLRGLIGEPDVVECAYVNSEVSEASYFSNPLLFGENGVAKNLHYGILHKYEQQFLKNALPDLLSDIKRGEDFIKKCDLATLN